MRKLGSAITNIMEDINIYRIMNNTINYEAKEVRSPSTACPDIATTDPGIIGVCTAELSLLLLDP